MPLTYTAGTIGGPPQHAGLMAYAMLAARPDFAMPPEKPSQFRRAQRLLRHADFERVYKHGRRHFSASMTVFYWPRVEEGRGTRTGVPAPRTQVPAAHGMRIGFTVGRALGGAVQRNRMKRRLREAVRLSPAVPNVDSDVVINPKKSLLTVEFSQIQSEVDRAFAVIEQKLSKSEEHGPEAGSGKRESGSRS